MLYLHQFRALAAMQQARQNHKSLSIIKTLGCSRPVSFLDCAGASGRQQQYVNKANKAAACFSASACGSCSGAARCPLTRILIQLQISTAICPSLNRKYHCFREILFQLGSSSPTGNEVVLRHRLAILHARASPAGYHVHLRYRHETPVACERTTLYFTSESHHNGQEISFTFDSLTLHPPVATCFNPNPELRPWQVSLQTHANSNQFRCFPAKAH